MKQSDIKEQLMVLELDKLAHICTKLKLKRIDGQQKEEIVERLVDTFDEADLRKHLRISWWARYHNHAYGVASVVGLLVAIGFYLYPSITTTTKVILPSSTDEIDGIPNVLYLDRATQQQNINALLLKGFSLPNFISLNWNDPMELVINKVKSTNRFNFKHPRDHSEREYDIINHGNNVIGLVVFGNQLFDTDVAFTKFFFYGNKLRKVEIYFTPDYDKVLQKYRHLRDELVNLYGKPQKNLESTFPPYIKNVNDEEAIKNGKAAFFSAWVLDNYNGVIIEIQEELGIMMLFDFTEGGA